MREFVRRLCPAFPGDKLRGVGRSPTGRIARAIFWTLPKAVVLGAAYVGGGLLCAAFILIVMIYENTAHGYPFRPKEKKIKCTSEVSKL